MPECNWCGNEAAGPVFTCPQEGCGRKIQLCAECTQLKTNNLICVDDKCCCSDHRKTCAKDTCNNPVCPNGEEGALCASCKSPVELVDMGEEDNLVEKCSAQEEEVPAVKEPEEEPDEGEVVEEAVDDQDEEEVEEPEEDPDWSTTKDNDYTHTLGSGGTWEVPEDQEDRYPAVPATAEKRSEEAEKSARLNFFLKTQYFLTGPTVRDGDTDEIYINNKSWRKQKVTIRYHKFLREREVVAEEKKVSVTLERSDGRTDTVVHEKASLTQSEDKSEYIVKKDDPPQDEVRYARKAEVKLDPKNNNNVLVKFSITDIITHENAVFGKTDEEFIVRSRAEPPQEIGRYPCHGALYAIPSAPIMKKAFDYEQRYSEVTFDLGAKKSKTINRDKKTFDGWIADIEVKPYPAGCLETNAGSYRFDGAAPGGRCNLSITKTDLTWLERQWYCAPGDFQTASATAFDSYAKQSWVELYKKTIKPMWEAKNPTKQFGKTKTPPDEFKIPMRFFMIWLGKIMPESLKQHIVNRKKMFREATHVFMVDSVAWEKHPDVTVDSKKAFGKWCRENGILLCNVRDIFGTNVEKMVCAKQYDFAVRYVPLYKGYAMGSDILRLELLRKYGGWYMDCDYMLYGTPRLFAHCDLVGGCLPDMSLTNQDPANAVFGAVKNHGFIQKYLEHIRDNWGNQVLKRLSYNEQGTQRITRFKSGDALTAEVEACTPEAYTALGDLDNPEHFPAINVEAANGIMDDASGRIKADGGPERLCWAIEPGNVGPESNTIKQRQDSAPNKATIRGTGPKVVRKVIEDIVANGPKKLLENAFFGGGLEMFPQKIYRSGPYAWGGEANEAQSW